MKSKLIKNSSERKCFEQQQWLALLQLPLLLQLWLSCYCHDVGDIRTSLPLQGREQSGFLLLVAPSPVPRRRSRRRRHRFDAFHHHHHHLLLAELPLSRALLPSNSTGELALERLSMPSRTRSEEKTTRQQRKRRKKKKKKK